MNENAKIPCSEVVERLWEYIDEELADPDSAAVRAHLDACARCFPQYDFQRAYREFLRCTGDQPVPAELRQRVFEAMLVEEVRAMSSADAEPAAQRDTAVPATERRWWHRLLGGS
jgi:mycothiol system anti-sigma-R factor